MAILGARDFYRPEVLLTGATGFFGRSLLAQLTRAGHRVHALVQPESRPSLRALVARLGREDREAAARVEPLVGGMTSPGLGLDAQTLEALAPAVGWIVHAASATEPATDPDVLEDVKTEHRVKRLRSQATESPRTVENVIQVKQVVQLLEAADR